MLLRIQTLASLSPLQSPLRFPAPLYEASLVTGLGILGAPPRKYGLTGNGTDHASRSSATASKLEAQGGPIPPGGRPPSAGAPQRRVGRTLRTLGRRGWAFRRCQGALLLAHYFNAPRRCSRTAREPPFCFCFAFCFQSPKKNGKVRL